MTAYLMIGITIILFAVLLKNIYYNSNESLYMTLVGFILILFSGLRGDFCTDYRSYYDFFRIINANFTFSEIWHGTFYNEKGFVFFNKIIGLFTDKPEVFLFIISFLIIVFFFVVLKKYSNCVWLSVLLFVGIGTFYDSFNVTRQILASAIAFLGARYLFEKNFIKYCLVVVVSVLFHRTAVLLIPLYFILVSKISKKKVIILFVSGIAAYIGLPILINIARIVLPAYKNYYDFSGGGNIKWLVLPMALLIFTYVVIKCRKVDTAIFDDPVMNVSLNALLLYAFLVIAGMQSQMVVRMATFMQPYTWILIPNLLIEYNNSRERQIIVMIVSILAVLYPVITLAGTGYDPYYTIWASF